MKEFTIEEIENGFIISGPGLTEMGNERDLFLPTIHAIADILIIWQDHGFQAAIDKSKKKYGGLYG
ncbi:hypothetical protein ES707_00308 [subsurface metagenome]